jgi:hypothetical protein
MLTFSSVNLPAMNRLLSAAFLPAGSIHSLLLESQTCRRQQYRSPRQYTIPTHTVINNTIVTFTTGFGYLLTTSRPKNEWFNNHKESHIYIVTNKRQINTVGN